jgi:hypothetical protein
MDVVSTNKHQGSDFLHNTSTTLRYTFLQRNQSNAVAASEAGNLERLRTAYRTTANVSSTVNIQTPLLQRVLGAMYLKQRAILQD